MGEEISLLNILFLYCKTVIRYIFPTKLIKLYIIQTKIENKLKQTVIAYIYYDYTLITTYLPKNIDYIPALVKNLKDRTPAKSFK